MAVARILVLAPVLLGACGGDDDDGGGGFGCSIADAHWVVEGEPLAVAVACAPSALEPLPVGASYDPATATLTWTPALDQAAVYELRAPDADGALTVGVADAFGAPDNVPVVDPLAYPTELGVPVMFLDPAPSTEEYAPTTIVYGGVAYAAEAKLRGASSLGYPKNSYLIRFADHQRFEDGARGFVHRRRVVLTSTFDDNSYLRQRLAFELWNRIDPDHIQVQAAHAVVYVDGAYWGLYLLGDHIDGDLMKASGLWEDGNLYKAITHDANFRRTGRDGEPKATLHDGYEKKEGPADDLGDLDALVAFVADSDDATFAAELDARIDRRDYEDWWAVAVLAQADDSAGKNSYHFHNPNVGPWRVVPWDFNASFGQDWQTRRQPATDVSLYEWANHLFERMLADPGAPMQTRLGALVRGDLEADAVIAMVDGWAAELDRSARRDWARWSDAYRSYPGWSDRDDFTTYDEELAYLRAWIRDRWATLEATLP